MMDKWAEKLLERFTGRETLNEDDLYERFFQSEGLEKDQVKLCFEEIKMGFHIPVGVLRPGDPLSMLTDRVPASNPLEWFWWLGNNEFSDQSLLEELNIRLRKYDTFEDWKIILTFEDLVRAWCGKKPRL